MIALCIVPEQQLVSDFLDRLKELGIQFRVVKEYLGNQIELILTEEDVNLIRLSHVPVTIYVPGDKVPKDLTSYDGMVYRPKKPYVDESTPYQDDSGMLDFWPGREYREQFQSTWSSHSEICRCISCFKLAR